VNDTQTAAPRGDVLRDGRSWEPEVAMPTVDDVPGRSYDDFESFVVARMPALLRFGHVLTGSPTDAADLVQDALERTGANWSRVQRKDNPEAYVRRAMVNRNITTWRRRRREQLVAETPDVSYNDLPPKDAALWAQLGRLPARQRAVVVLRYYEDLSEAETAAVLDISVGTVKSQTSKALATLRERLVTDDGSESSWTR
jgi:RNA polymerase sigma-70 factor (sigma-E family)